MKLLTRFNLFFLAIFVGSLTISLWLASEYLRRVAEERIHGEAELIAEAASATRQYTEQQVRPLLTRLQRRESSFLVQSVPTYSAIQVFDYLHKNNPQYTYKDAMLNPTNPSDRAAGWEMEVINAFQNDSNLQILSRERESSMGRSYFFARPIRIPASQKACLECHSNPGRAPAAMIRQYGTANGFGWKTDTVLGAQIITVPASVPIQMAHTALQTLALYLIGAGLLMLVILDWLLVVTVIRPVITLSRQADAISHGRLGNDLPVRGRDEISTLASSFNRMQRSLAKALKLLE